MGQARVEGADHAGGLVGLGGNDNGISVNTAPVSQAHAPPDALAPQPHDALLEPH